MKKWLFGPSQPPSTPPQPPSPPLQQKTIILPTTSSSNNEWECSVCTLLNSTQSTTCSACHAPKPSAPSSSWSCSVCTYENAFHFTQCEMCQASRPTFHQHPPHQPRPVQQQPLPQQQSPPQKKQPAAVQGANFLDDVFAGMATPSSSPEVTTVPATKPQEATRQTSEAKSTTPSGLAAQISPQTKVGVATEPQVVNNSPKENSNARSISREGQSWDRISSEEIVGKAHHQEERRDQKEAGPNVHVSNPQISSSVVQQHAPSSVPPSPPQHQVQHHRSENSSPILQPSSSSSSLDFSYSPADIQALTLLLNRGRYVEAHCLLQHFLVLQGSKVEKEALERSRLDDDLLEEAILHRDQMRTMFEQALDREAFVQFVLFFDHICYFPSLLGVLREVEGGNSNSSNAAVGGSNNSSGHSRCICIAMANFLRANGGVAHILGSLPVCQGLEKLLRTEGIPFERRMMLDYQIRKKKSNALISQNGEGGTASDLSEDTRLSEIFLFIALTELSRRIMQLCCCRLVGDEGGEGKTQKKKWNPSDDSCVSHFGQSFASSQTSSSRKEKWEILLAHNLHVLRQQHQNNKNKVDDNVEDQQKAANEKGNEKKKQPKKTLLLDGLVIILNLARNAHSHQVNEDIRANVSLLLAEILSCFDRFFPPPNNFVIPPIDRRIRKKGGGGGVEEKVCRLTGMALEQVEPQDIVVSPWNSDHLFHRQSAGLWKYAMGDDSYFGRTTPSTQ